MILMFHGLFYSCSFAFHVSWLALACIASCFLTCRWIQTQRMFLHALNLTNIWGHVKHHVLNPLLPAIAFQWTRDFHTIIDVESNSVHYHQHILWLTHLHVETNSLMCRKKSTFFNKFWSSQIVATSETLFLFLDYGWRMDEDPQYK